MCRPPIVPSPQQWLVRFLSAVVPNICANGQLWFDVAAKISRYSNMQNPWMPMLMVCFAPHVIEAVLEQFTSGHSATCPCSTQVTWYKWCTELFLGKLFERKLLSRSVTASTVETSWNMQKWVSIGALECQVVLMCPDSIGSKKTSTLEPLTSKISLHQHGLCLSATASLSHDKKIASNCAGQMKDLATTGLGLVLFHDVQFSANNILGVSIGMSGAMLYSFLSYWERNNVRSQWFASLNWWELIIIAANDRHKSAAEPMWWDWLEQILWTLSVRTYQASFASKLLRVCTVLLSSLVVRILLYSAAYISSFA